MLRRQRLVSTAPTAGEGLAPGLSRRAFFRRTAALAGLVPAVIETASLFRISLAEWSLHRSLFAGELDHLDLAATARGLGIDGVEYVNQFFAHRAQDQPYLRKMKRRCADHGVESLLIMCDNEGRLGDPDATLRQRSVEAHRKWLEAARFLGCHSIRVNAHSEGSFEEQQKLVADGLHRLSERGAELDLNVLVENHGGLSSNGRWLAGVMQRVGHERCGTLPDFGNFGIYGGYTYSDTGAAATKEGDPPGYDRYLGVEELMPYARAVSAKSNAFDAAGNERDIDYRRMLAIVLDAGYRGWIGVEYSGSEPPEIEGIEATKALLETLRAELLPRYRS